MVLGLHTEHEFLTAQLLVITLLCVFLWTLFVFFQNPGFNFDSGPSLLAGL